MSCIQIKVSLSHILIIITSLFFFFPTDGTLPRKDRCQRVYPHQSIQEAIDHASPGDRIEVEGGVYYEQLTIRTDNIHLIGKGAVLKPPMELASNNCSGLSQSPEGKATEAGICFQGRGIQLLDYVQEHRRIKSVDEFVKDVLVTGFTVSGFDGENIAAVGAQNIEIIENTLTEGGQYGFLSVGSKGTHAEGNIVTTTAINFVGLLADDYSDAVLSKNDVTSYFTALVSQTPGGRITKNKAYNVCVGGAADPGVQGSLITDNHFTLRNPGCNKDYPAFGAGIVVFGANETIVKGNTIEKFNNGGFGIGIFLLDGPQGEIATKNKAEKNLLRFNDVDIYDNSTGLNEFRDNACDSVSNSPIASFLASTCA